MKTAKKPAKKSIAAKFPRSRLTLGPLFFNWSAEKRRDFYFRIADETDIDSVCLGEVVCSKRECFFEKDMPVVAERLKKSGKEVVLSTLALVTSEREMKGIEHHVTEGYLIEANDVACLQALNGKEHVVGPFINIFNESARDFACHNGAVRIVLPVEIPAPSIEILARKSKAEIEVLVFGRQPLAVAMRCYHARANGVNRDSCRFVCGQDPDGLIVDTMDGQKILAINGTQTLSSGYGVLLNELDELHRVGVTHFRLSPQDVDMVQVAGLYRSVLDKKLMPQEALKKLKVVVGDVPMINGFYHGREGLVWEEKA